jgi:putative ABC transport system permease protein
VQLAVGARFAGAHGFVGSGELHEHRPYRVVGVLQATGTVLDRLILTSLDSVWDLHGHTDAHADEEAHEHEHGSDSAEGREITAMLLGYASPLAAVGLPREINASSGLQAAAPAFELTRLLQLVGLGLDGLRAFAGVLVLTAGFGVFAALYGALAARRYDVALLRCLGATRAEVLLSLLLEGLMLAAMGAALGLLLGHGAMELLAHWLGATRGVTATGWIWLPAEGALLLGLLVVGLLAAALPAWRAYRVDAARTLAQS